MTWFRSRLDISQLNYICQQDVISWTWTEEKIKALIEMDLDEIAATPWAYMKLAEFASKEYSFHQLDFYMSAKSGIDMYALGYVFMSEFAVNAINVPQRIKQLYEEGNEKCHRIKKSRKQNFTFFENQLF